MADTPRYTLDTSAIVAFMVGEPGAGEVESILSRSWLGKAEAFASFATYTELLYRVWRERGEKEGKLAYLRLKALAVERVDVTEGLLIRAGRFKAEHQLSLADAWVAATALITGSVLVHKDPEFRPLKGKIGLLELPLKTRRSSG